MERELAVIKQKYQLSLANPDLDSTNFTEEKENVDDLIIPDVKPLPKKSEIKDKHTPVALIGKRTLEEMISPHPNKPRPFNGKPLHNLIGGKDKKLSTNKGYKGFESKQDFASILKPSFDDITNQDIDIKKRVKQT